MHLWALSFPQARLLGLKRPQRLLLRAATQYRVFFWKEPIWHKPGEIAADAGGVEGARLDIAKEASSLWVMQPHLTEGLDPEMAQRKLLDRFVDRCGLSNFVRWYYTPMALGFSRQLHPAAIEQSLRAFGSLVPIDAVLVIYPNGGNRVALSANLLYERQIANGPIEISIDTASSASRNQDGNPSTVRFHP